jgi:UTP--glucose-1-phosphate uridylyltransferase
MKIRKAVLPAAGLGTRFLPATKAIPKEMLPIADKPLIQYSVEECINSGIKDIIIITGTGKDAIEDHFDVSFELEKILKERGKQKLLKKIQAISKLTDLIYTRQKEPRGVGHAVLMAKDIVGLEPFAVLFADDIINSEVPCLKQMIDIFNKYQSSVIAIQQVEEKEVERYGIIKAKKIEERLYEVEGLIEKPPLAEAPSNLAIIGRYIITPEIFAELEKTEIDHTGEIQLTNGLRGLLKSQKVLAYQFEGTRYDAGDKLGFLQATVELALKNGDFGEHFRAFLKSLKL